MENPEVTPKVTEFKGNVPSLVFKGMRVEVAEGRNKEEQLRALEKGISVMKRKVEKDNIIQIIRDRKYYEKPSATAHHKLASIARKKELERRRKK